MATKYGDSRRLKDYTVGLPNRVDIIYAVRKFPAYRSNNVSGKWNIPHYRIADFFFANTPMAEHYNTYFKVALRKWGTLKVKRVKGQLMNQLIITYLYYLTAPQRHNHDGIVPILKAFATMKHTFIRHFHSAQRDWNEPELTVLEPLQNHNPKWYYPKKFGLQYANQIHHKVHERAMFLLPRFKKEVLEGGGEDKLVYYEFDNPMSAEQRAKIANS